MSDLSDIKEGDEVYYRDVNERRRRPDDDDWEPPLVTITKVGRTRVYFDRYRREEWARKSDGRVSDWTYLQTQADYHAAQARSEMLRFVKGHGFTVDLGTRVPDEKLAAVALALEGFEQ